MNEQLQAIATVLSLVNPAICAAMFSSAVGGLGTAAKVRQALMAAAVIAVILGLAALFGEKVLNTFGISLDAFRVAGGGVLAWMGFTMLRSNTDSEKRQIHSDNANPSLSPLIMFAASPGTITGVITLAVTHSKKTFPVSTLVAIVVAVAVTLLVMIAISFAGGKQQGGLVRGTITQFMGLIVIAMGVQFLLTGFKAFMA
jgi:multiple antibiotic resistance protein